jgi:hypothetical protein
VTLRFSDLNPLGRAIIIVVAALTFGVAAVSFATSYGALYAWVRDTGLYSDRLTRLWPLLLDGAFIVAQLAAILAGILRGSRAWPILTMLLTGALTVWFNLQHAGADPGRRLAAALPPVLMMLAFEIDVQIVKWVMQALGRPLGPITPPPSGGMLPGPVRVPCGALTGRAGTFPRLVRPTAGPRACMAAFGQATTFRKTRRTAKPVYRLGGWRRRWGDQAPAHRGVPGLAGSRRAPAPDRAGVDRRPPRERPRGHRALCQADPRLSATRTRTPDPAAAGERPS